MATKFHQVIQDLKNKIYHPIYFLSGEEPFYIDQISDFIEENVLNEMEREFDLNIVYGRDVSINDIVMAAKSFPMMAPQKVLIIKEAHALEKIEEISDYLSKPCQTTILVFCYKYKKMDHRKAFTKLLENTCVFFESPKLYDNQIPSWIADWCKAQGHKISNKACAMLAEFLGVDLSRIANELNKLFINIDASKEITPEHIEYFIGISKDYNIFELQKKLAFKDVTASFKIINYFISNQKDNPMLKVIPLMYTYFVRILILKLKPPNTNADELAATLNVGKNFLYDYQQAARNYSMGKLVQIISILREYDMKCKGVGAQGNGDAVLMKEMFTKILN